MNFPFLYHLDKIFLTKNTTSRATYYEIILLPDTPVIKLNSMLRKINSTDALFWFLFPKEVGLVHILTYGPGIEKLFARALLKI